MNSTIFISGDEVKIFINDILHLSFKEKILSLQSWNEQNKFWKIEIKTKHTSVLVEYDSEEKWKQILGLLNKV